LSARRAEPVRDRKVLTRRMASAEAWRDTKMGMWAWLLQRLAAVGLLAVIVAHLKNPFARPVQAALLALVLFHGLLGVRSILLDFGLPARWNRLRPAASRACKASQRAKASGVMIAVSLLNTAKQKASWLGHTRPSM
jgi:succinate dehydrogenase/fumarate reductase cytochrome b subunit